MVVAAALDLLRSASWSCSRLRVSDATNVFGLFASARWTSDVYQTVPFALTPLSLAVARALHCPQSWRSEDNSCLVYLP